MEGDASSASYFLAGAAITGGTVTVEGCGTSSLQVFLVPLRPWGNHILDFSILCLELVTAP